MSWQPSTLTRAQMPERRREGGRLLQAVLAHGESHGLPPYTQLGDHLQEGMAQLETSHPRLTFAMGQLSEMLARLGI